MTILVVGNTAPISDAFFQVLAPLCKCVVIDHDNQEGFHGKSVTNYKIKGIDPQEEARKVFGCYEFDAVVFLSYTINGNANVFSELEQLEQILNQCQKNGVRNFFYVASNDCEKTEKSNDLITRSLLMDACEVLCGRMAKEKLLCFRLIRIPFLYSIHCKDNPLYQWILQAMDGKAFFAGARYDEIDFLCEEDLALLLGRIIDDPLEQDSQKLCLTGKNVTTLYEIAENLTKLVGKYEVVFPGQSQSIFLPTVLSNELAKREYGWTPIHIMWDDVERIVEKERLQHKKHNGKLWRFIEKINLGERTRKFVELAVMCVLAEYLSRLTAQNALLSFLDPRLLMVVIVGASNGIMSGLLAALYACGSYVYSAGEASEWQVLFYNIENWIPFVSYLLVGSISGYHREKYDAELQFANEEYGLLEKKYIFLRQLYDQALQNKERYNSQIIGYEDSFGKIYSVVKKLNTTLQDEVFFEAVASLEQLLDTDTVAIYTIYEQSSYARLTVCSKKMNRILSRSMNMDMHQAVLSVIQKGQVYKNTRALPEEPQYCAPIIKEGKLVGMILIIEVNETQMSTEYMNKFSIVADLINDSLVRAIEHEATGDYYVKGTSVLTKERFAETLEVKNHMREKQYLDYRLLRILCKDMTLEECANKVSRLVRANDTLGLGEDDQLYLLLSQTRESDLVIIRERMESHNITFEIVT